MRRENWGQVLFFDMINIKGLILYFLQDHLQVAERTRTQFL